MTGIAGTWAAWQKFNSTAVRFAAPGTLLDMVAAVAAEAPERPAVQAGSAVLSYRELLRQAGRVAAFLRETGVPEGSTVAVTASISVHPYAAILGVLTAGCAYLPIDPAEPPERLRFMIRDAGAAALLALAGEAARLDGPAVERIPRAVLDGHSTAPGWRELAPADRGRPARGARTTGSALAYVIYTSGTTGRPKGVRICHSALLNFVHWFVERHGVRPGDRLAQVAPLTFDPSVQQIFPAWVTGACLVAVPGAELRDPAALLEWLAAERITHADLVTSHWHHLREAAQQRAGGAALPDLRWLVIGGETMYYHESHHWYSAVDSPARINNIYGPTEATINATEWEVAPGLAEGQVPIGVPLPNYRLYVVSPAGTLCPPGETGELVIAGTGLAERYQSAEATARAFGHLDLPDGTRERIYRSGDLARLITGSDGCWVLEFRGRTDSQVKIRGYRVELEEVEAAAKTCPGISAVAVLVRGEPARQLACVSTGPAPVAADRMRQHLAEGLPDYMVPNLYLWVPEFPVTRNGKLDRRALAAALEDALATRAAAADGPPVTTAGQAVMHAWAKALDLPQVGPDEDFFGLGGTSLLAAAAASMLRRQGWRVGVSDIYQFPTARALAAQLGGASHEPAGTARPGPRPAEVRAGCGIGAFDTLSRPEAEAQLLTCCASPAWAAAVAAGRPYGSLGALLSAAADALDALPWLEVRQAMSAHSRLGEPPASPGGDAALSRAEQAGLASAAPQARRALAVASRRYEERFGHVFLTCADGRDVTDILAELTARAASEPAAERAAAHRELAKITCLRLRRLLAEAG